MGDLDVFPLTARANPAGRLELGGCDVTELASQYGTPLYIFDEETLRRQALNTLDTLRSRWPDATVLYATKAYFSPFLAKLYRDLGLGLDVTSEGELEIARRVEFPRDKIYLHGNNKSEAEVRSALEYGVNHIVVDNLGEIQLIGELAWELDQSPRLLLRLSPEIDPHTHEFLTTVASSKFGLGIANHGAERVFEEIRRYPHLEAVGLHLHLGSQIFETDAFVRGLRCALDLAADWGKRFGFHLRELDLGGGWGVAYTGQQTAVDVDALSQEICSALSKGLARRELGGDVKLLVEPGRTLVARAAVTLYRVGFLKEISHERTYAAIDGGMGDNIRPPLYGAVYSARVANKFTVPSTRSYTVAGRYCEQGDVLIEKADLPFVERGDLLAVPVAGAYQLPMASNYNLIPRPAVVLVKDGQSRLLRRRETIDDLLACDVP